MEEPKYIDWNEIHNATELYRALGAYLGVSKEIMNNIVIPDFESWLEGKKKEWEPDIKSDMELQSEVASSRHEYLSCPHLNMYDIINPYDYGEEE